MSKKSVLGKGLGALIPDEIHEKEIEEENTLPIESIKSNNNQPRKSFDEERIKELAQSIKEFGIIQPIIVKKIYNENKYEIVAGERRWRAAKLAGLEEVPVIIKEISNREVLEISLIENIQREDLNPIEESKAYQELLKNFNLTQEDLSKKLGKSRVAITNSLRLLNLDDRVQEMLIHEIITEGHGRALLAIKDTDIQFQIAQKIVINKLSVRETEKLVKSLNKKEEVKENTKVNNNPYYDDIKNRLEDFFQTKVKIENKNNKGKIEIEYYSEEDLQRIIDILNLE
ncbi:ParB/RepB/Spo0J family partition protein [Clostridium cochlearium]|jgi:ParB family chromosome partitioning protein|uniref:Chromosome segregation DNA-binding protein n=1 Tax=Clostridium cochlearium TaxID=1494 RepID=A0ABY0QKD1_CLOCO|nr:ParB/RepB/Spo0J family partition protein [Clostridium cochlearium]MBE6065646.1 ParB/RepB/Spo0J family partition protein [Clostridium cochlearium]MDU1443880.1 ParB/RepB/Spo0J family partition protein [Clostridium cochlearium]NMA58316.1 ParB/RepB/Spo0J family partition protein [Clostridium cochlearium]NME95185.1 ParB/RepB/Spo0J family partition protein [Clostridium cochlearium]SDL04301.1 chromosome segregation DNA-binding protein [Clostridium cochlearium]